MKIESHGHGTVLNVYRKIAHPINNQRSFAILIVNDFKFYNERNKINHDFSFNSHAAIRYTSNICIDSRTCECNTFSADSYCRKTD